MFSSLVIYRQENQILEFTFLDYEWLYFVFFFYWALSKTLQFSTKNKKRNKNYF